MQNIKAKIEAFIGMSLLSAWLGCASANEFCEGIAGGIVTANDETHISITGGRVSEKEVSGSEHGWNCAWVEQEESYDISQILLHGDIFIFSRGHYAEFSNVEPVDSGLIHVFAIVHSSDNGKITVIHNLQAH